MINEYDTYSENEIGESADLYQETSEGHYDDQPDEDDSDQSLDGYGDVSAIPADFNIKTLVGEVERGVFNIPGFQRNFKWDIKRASKFIESLIIGIPIPQIFLWEEAKNKLLVIDGQQRLLSAYFFLQGRFPRVEKRADLRKIFADNKNQFPKKTLDDNTYFVDFNLDLGKENQLSTKNYGTLEDTDRDALTFRPLRTITIKHSSPKGEKGQSVVFEIFNRLNTGGINLTPQEIRTSLYHSKFYDMLYDINLNSSWRKLVGNRPDNDMRDIEVLLRGFAMLVGHEKYRPSMKKFLNSFSAEAKKFDENEISRLKRIFEDFVSKCEAVDGKLFLVNNNKFAITLYESVFVAFASSADEKGSVTKELDKSKVERLKSDEDFLGASQHASANTEKIRTRIKRALELL